MYRPLPWHYMLIGSTALLTVVFLYAVPTLFARNIIEYRDTISDSAPNAQANHTLEFTVVTDIAPNARLEITPPPGFEILATSTFAERNVELLVNGVPRVATTSASPGVDGVSITTGSPGFIAYELAPDNGLAAGDSLQLRIGNHTTNALTLTEVFSTSTGTTTIPGDIEPIVNATATGTQTVQLEIYEGSELVADAGFVIVLIERVGVGPADTRETVPPFRFNGAPTSTVGGTTPFVEISLETDEFAICRWSSTANTAYASMTNVFVNSYTIFHNVVVPVTPGTLQTFYVRCIDDEGNQNIDDFLIQFAVNELPTGQANTEGDVSGDGSGEGNQGTGDGSGSGGTTGDSSGEAPLLGGSAGTGGSGGGGGGGSGGVSGNTAGGGFESTDAPYRSGDGRVVISGYAFPRSRVSILVDGTLAQTVPADNQGEYEVTLDQIARGVYTFGIYATGPDNIKSSTFSTSFTVTGARTSALTNINIAPSIAVAPNPVDPGATLTVSGYAIPNATITVENGRSGTRGQPQTTTSDGNGRWTTTINTTGFSNGTYQVRARAEQASGLGIRSNFSEYTFYGVGEAADVPLTSDLNRDGRVNLVDFSILLFWWNTDGGTSNPPADINRDRRVNLTDFSILLFNWTG